MAGIVFLHTEHQDAQKKINTVLLRYSERDNNCPLGVDRVRSGAMKPLWGAAISACDVFTGMMTGVNMIHAKLRRIMVRAIRMKRVLVKGFSIHEMFWLIINVFINKDYTDYFDNSLYPYRSIRISLMVK